MTIRSSPLGTLPVGWTLRRLADLTTKIGSGATPTGGQKVYLQSRERVALIRSQHVFDRWFDRQGLAFISEKHAHELRNAEVQADDILLNITGDGITFGRACMVPPDILPACVNQHVSIVRTDKRLCDPRFLVSYLTHPLIKGYIESFNAGGSRRAITKGHIESFEVPLPSLDMQERIGAILQAFDDRIELNRRMNETLEAMARALFKSWFVNFDPVHAKAAVRREHPKWTNAQVSRAALPNLTPAVAELFPDSFEDSALGPIPAGWSLSPLRDHVDASKGLSYKGSGLSDAGMPMHNLNSVYEGGGYKFEGIKFYTGEYHDRHLVNAGDVIVANTEQGHDCLLIGYAAIVPGIFGQQGLYSHHLYRLQIRTGSPLTPDSLCRLLNSRRMHEVVSGFGNGTTVNMLPVGGLEHPEFVLPPSTLLQAFTTLAVPIRNRQERFVKETRDLALTRDSLLPRLLSGELAPAECHP